MFNFRLLVLVILGLAGNCKFQETPSYSFVAYDPPDIFYLDNIDLLTDQNHLAVTYDNSSNGNYHQDFYNFDGTKLCEIQYEKVQKLLAFPAQSKGIYFNRSNNSIIILRDLCSDPQVLQVLNTSLLRSAFSHTSKDSFMSIVLPNNKLLEYKISTGSVTREFQIDSENQIIKSINYSPDHTYLFVEVFEKSSYKVIIFDADSGDRKRQIATDFRFVKGNPNGNGFIAKNQTSDFYYSVNSKGQKKQIWTPKFSQNYTQSDIAICTNQNHLIALKVSKDRTNPSFQIYSYNSINGQLNQKFALDFVPKANYMDCNDDYMAIMDPTGRMHVFKYSRALPAWATFLIVVASSFLIGGIVSFALYKRKQNKKEDKYSIFDSEEKSLGKV